MGVFWHKLWEDFRGAPKMGPPTCPTQGAAVCPPHRRQTTTAGDEWDGKGGRRDIDNDRVDTNIYRVARISIRYLIVATYIYFLCLIRYL